MVRKQKRNGGCGPHSSIPCLQRMSVESVHLRGTIGTRLTAFAVNSRGREVYCRARGGCGSSMNPCIIFHVRRSDDRDNVKYKAGWPHWRPIKAKSPACFSKHQSKVSAKAEVLA